MAKRFSQFLILACLSCSWCWAGNDPFIGKWKLDTSKTVLTDEMKIAIVDANKFTLIFDGTNNTSEKIVADGTDQPGIAGTTLAVTIEDPRTVKVVRKKDGHELLTAIWRLSE